MRLRTWLLLLVLAAASVIIWRIEVARSQPPEVPFARVLRQTIISSVPTNGKVEPIEWAVARAERSGPVGRILIQLHQRVSKDEPLVEIDSSDARAEAASAEARISQIRAELDVINKGGRASDLAEISSALDRARLELETAQIDYDSKVRLQAKQAGTAYEVTVAKERLNQAQLQINSLNQRRAALVVPSDRTAAEARLKDAQAAAQLAESKLRMSVVRAPMAGTIYQFDLKGGAYLNAGDAVASIGRLERVHVTVYVDEPDLGRVAKGMPVTITWDALPGRQWKGQVDRTATQIVALGSRQVGEVVCWIENPKAELLPGTNVNAEIRSESVENALTIPKEALRREGGASGVFILDGDKVVWRTVKLGVNNTTRTQVEGLNDGDAVALPSEKPLKDGMMVRPVFP